MVRPRVTRTIRQVDDHPVCGGKGIRPPHVGARPRRRFGRTIGLRLTALACCLAGLIVACLWPVERAPGETGNAGGGPSAKLTVPQAPTWQHSASSCAHREQSPAATGVQHGFYDPDGLQKRQRGIPYAEPNVSSLASQYLPTPKAGERFIATVRGNDETGDREKQDAKKTNAPRPSTLIENPYALGNRDRTDANMLPTRQSRWLAPDHPEHAHWLTSEPNPQHISAARAEPALAAIPARSSETIPAAPRTSEELSYQYPTRQVAHGMELRPRSESSVQFAREVEPPHKQSVVRLARQLEPPRAPKRDEPEASVLAAPVASEPGEPAAPQAAPIQPPAFCEPAPPPTVPTETPAFTEVAAPQPSPTETPAFSEPEPPRRSEREAPPRAELGAPHRPDSRAPRLVEPLPPQPVGGEKTEHQEEPITLHLDNVDVRKALELLSREASINILVSPSVSGHVTANIDNLSFREALDALLRLCNLVARHEDNLIFIYDAKEIPQGQCRIRTFPLDFIAADDAQASVQALLSPVGQAFVAGTSSADNRKTQDVLTVYDIPEQLDVIGQFIAQIDQPPRQVMIEVNVLEVDLGDDCKHGVNFEQLIKLSGNKIGLNLTGFANPAAPQAFFIAVDGHDLDGLLEVLKSTNDTKTLASPRVAVVNGQEANIQIGEQLGYRVTTVTETAAVEDVKFLDVGVLLNVTPRISRDGRVVMRVAPKVSAGVVNQDTGLPQEETTQVETDVLLSNGQGMVIGGLIQEKDSSLRQKIPWLGDIWLVGYLFQRNYTEKTRSEIIITLKPVVLPPAQPNYQIRQDVEVERASTPLLYGPLCPYPRPWEPRMPRPCDIENRIRMRPPFFHDPCRNGYPCEYGPYDARKYDAPESYEQLGSE